MPGPQTTILLVSLSAISGLVCMRQWQRRAVLARLQVVLGHPIAGYSFGFGRALGEIGSRIPGGADASLQSALLRAGYFHPAALHLFVALRLLFAVAAFLFVLLRASALAPLVFVAAAFSAFFVSRLFVICIKLKADRRERLLRRELPPLVDVLMMVLNSGISIDQSLRYVTGMLGRTAPISSAVLKRYVADIDSGMPFEAAFERMGQRLALNEGYDLANLIKQSLLQGGEIMASLESFGAELTDKRVALAREQIGRKSVLLTLVMLAFFMPVLMIVLGGPAVSQIMQTLNTVKHELHHREMRR